MQKILISACLLGEKVRYNGTDKLLSHPAIAKWQMQKRFIVICPEVSGGLPVPRPPSEKQDNGIIITDKGEDVSDAFTRGAQHALNLCQQNHIRYALLKARSPSCGNNEIYNGQFSGETIEGSGVTAELLMANGIKVFNEAQIDELSDVLERVGES